MSKIRHIGIVTSGGDAPGTNAAIRAIARVAMSRNIRVSGVLRSWTGAVEGEFIDIGRDDIHGIVMQGGTILKSERTKLLTQPGDAAKVIRGLKKRGIQALAVIGGEGSHKGALELHNAGFPVVGVPKTIDNDLGGTYYTIGFQTAVETATSAIDRVRTHTESNDRVMIVEVMGRHAGWIAAWSGIASGADLILVPEREWSIDEVCDHLTQRHKRQRRVFSLIVAAEGAVESLTASRNARRGGTTRLINFGKDSRADHLGRKFLGGIGEPLAAELEHRTGFECRSTSLGYLLRGGAPVAADRLLATRLGVNAAEALLAGKSGVTIGQYGGDVRETALAEATATLKRVPEDAFELAARFF